MKSLIKLHKQQERFVIGLMSGTSLDGVDIALVKLAGTGNSLNLDLIDFKTFPMEKTIKQRIQSAFQGTTEEICKLHYDLGKYFGTLILLFLEQISFPLEKIDLIGSHGQTLYHVHNHSSLQCGEADIIANLTEKVVVHDFRAADIASGGCGAPLIPYMDSILFRCKNESRILLNIGGISNLTYLPADVSKPIMAFDTGAGNMVLNEMIEWITQGKECFDQNGTYSKQGKTIQFILEELLKHPFFKESPPKSTGREMFGKQYVHQIISNYPEYSPYDLLRTVVSLTTHSIVNAIKQFLPSWNKIYISGGGVHNPVLLEELKTLLSSKKIDLFSELSPISEDAKEAVAFAILAHERCNGTPTNLPLVTGAKQETCLGKFALPT